MVFVCTLRTIMYVLTELIRIFYSLTGQIYRIKNNENMYTYRLFFYKITIQLFLIMEV